MSSDNRRETGARALKPGTRDANVGSLDTGDRGDEPPKPYGLTRRVDETEAETHQSDGQQPAAEPAQGKRKAR